MATGNGILVPDTARNDKQCICGDCPTSKKSLLDGWLFCARGKARETVKQVGCTCGSCPVYARYGLNLEYFCVRGMSVDNP